MSKHYVFFESNDGAQTVFETNSTRRAYQLTDAERNRTNRIVIIFNYQYVNLCHWKRGYDEDNKWYRLESLEGQQYLPFPLWLKDGYSHQIID